MTWQPGDCTICLLHERALLWPLPRFVFWHQRGLPPLPLDWPDPADRRDHGSTDGPYDDWYNLEPVVMPHWNRHRRKEKRHAKSTLLRG